MNAELWAEIRRLHRIAQWGVTDIARHLRIDRKTVRKALAAERVPVVVRVRKQPTLLATYTGYVQERLKTYPRLPATVLLQELQKQGYLGSLRILQDYLKGVRRQAKEVFLRIETSPGEQAQCDWANCGTVKIGRIHRKLSAFVMLLSYSRLLYVEFTLSQCLEDFIQCHINAFEFFGGVPNKVLYDNLKAVVLSRVGTDIRFNPAFMEFAGVYGFQPVPCNVRRGNEKGKVENGIYYLRVNFLAGRVLQWPQANAEVQAWLQDIANVRKHRTTGERPVDLWETEKPFLIPLPERPFDAGITRAVRSSHQSLVRFESNFYSVPHAYAYRTLILKATPTHVRLLSETTEVALHRRSFDRGIVIENPQHYEGVLSTKRKHFGLILTKRFRELGPLANTFLEGLLRTESRPAQSTPPPATSTEPLTSRAFCSSKGPHRACRKSRPSTSLSAWTGMSSPPKTPICPFMTRPWKRNQTFAYRAIRDEDRITPDPQESARVAAGNAPLFKSAVKSRVVCRRHCPSRQKQFVP